jgi:uncharacterized membrane protein YfhO
MFAVSYDDGWKAFINGKEQIPDKYHFIVSDFANGWYVNNKAEHNFNIKLYYQPQNYHQIGLIVYAVIACICLFLLLYDERNKVRYFIKGTGRIKRLLKLSQQ